MFGKSLIVLLIYLSVCETPQALQSLDLQE